MPGLQFHPWSKFSTTASNVVEIFGKFLQLSHSMCIFLEIQERAYWSLSRCRVHCVIAFREPITEVARSKNALNNKGSWRFYFFFTDPSYFISFIYLKWNGEMEAETTYQKYIFPSVLCRLPCTLIFLSLTRHRIAIVSNNGENLIAS